MQSSLGIWSLEPWIQKLLPAVPRPWAMCCAQVCHVLLTFKKPVRWSATPPVAKVGGNRLRDIFISTSNRHC